MIAKSLCRILGFYLLFFAAALLLPLFLSVYYEYLVPPELHPQPHATGAFFSAFCVCLGIACALSLIGRKADRRIYRKEGLAIVILIWFVTAFVAALPFYFSGTLSKPLDAYFEAISGLTTTGASVMHPKAYDPRTGKEIQHVRRVSGFYDIVYRFKGTVTPVRSETSGEITHQGIEAVSKAILFWRSFIQWLGGMGIVVLFVAVLPALGIGGKVLYQAEVPGPSKEGITPRIKETATLLWTIYLILTVLEIILLKMTNASLGMYDAVCITFSTISTGGFSVYGSSIGTLMNGTTEAIITVFMLLGSINFALYFQCWRGKFYHLFQAELVLYFLILFVASGFVAWNLIGVHNSLMIGGTPKIFTVPEAWRYAIFQVVSTQSSTGFTTANYEAWPPVCQVVMLIVMYFGGMSGSTAGGMKVIRHFMLFKICQSKVESMFRPQTVRVLRVGGRELGRSAQVTVLCFFLIVMALSALGTLLFALDGMDPETALSVNGCMINNIGIAFRVAGPTESFAFMSPFSKMISIFWMVLGRLEFFAVLVFLTPAYWKK